MVSRKRSAWAIAAIVTTSVAGCGPAPARNAIRGGLKDAGLEIKSLKGPANKSGQFTVQGEDGSEMLLEVTKEGGEFVIENCTDQDQQTQACPQVPTNQPLKP